MSTPPPSQSSASQPPADPLDVFVANHRRALGKKRGPRFNAGEHAWLASAGANAACKALADRGIAIPWELFDSISRRDGKERMQYGELVALSGDFYETPSELFEEKSSFVNIPGHTNDLDDLREVFAEELRWIEARWQGTGGTTYPDENLRLAWNAKSYVELALRNTDHFGWHNIVAYCKHHAEALRLAQSTRGKESQTFRRALYTNAFADHFLTDGFAAGHIRVPRAEIRAWAQDKGLTEKIAGSLSKLLHDQDGHVDVHSLHGQIDENRRPDNDGLHVQNADGTSWYTYCDGQLFLETDAGKKAVERAVAAVAASVTEFLVAWKVGDLPQGTYEATRHVPFPHPDAPKLVEKFAADMPEAEFERLWESVSWYAKIPWLAGLEATHVRSLFEALPEIMARFRENIAAAADVPELSKRIAPPYIDAYKQIA